MRIRFCAIFRSRLAWLAKTSHKNTRRWRAIWILWIFRTALIDEEHLQKYNTSVKSDNITWFHNMYTSRRVQNLHARNTNTRTSDSYMHDGDITGLFLLCNLTTFHRCRPHQLVFMFSWLRFHQASDPTEGRTLSSGWNVPKPPWLKNDLERITVKPHATLPSRDE